MDPANLDYILMSGEKILTSKVFDSCKSDHRKAIVDFTKHTCINEIKFQNNNHLLKYSYKEGKMHNVKPQYTRSMTYLRQMRQKQFYLLKMPSIP